MTKKLLQRSQSQACHCCKGRRVSVPLLALLLSSTVLCCRSSSSSAYVNVAHHRLVHNDAGHRPARAPARLVPWTTTRCIGSKEEIRRTPPTGLTPSSNAEDASTSSVVVDPLADLTEPEDVNFGRMDYWNEEYRQASSKLDGDDEGDKGNEGEFSWYTGWSDLEPFFTELVPDKSSKVLIPGIGNDAAMVDMYDSGYYRMMAFDYAPEGVECARKMFGPDRLKMTATTDSDGEGVATISRPGATLLVADARSLPFTDNSFDAMLEKGTLDAVYLSGGKDKEVAAHHLSMAVNEFARVIRLGGIVFSVTAACVDAVQDSFGEGEGTLWKQVRDGSFYITEEDGIASNAVDASILAWERL